MTNHPRSPRAQVGLGEKTTELHELRYRRKVMEAELADVREQEIALEKEVAVLNERQYQASIVPIIKRKAGR